jgi:hypothetical protein
VAESSRGGGKDGYDKSCPYMEDDGGRAGARIRVKVFLEDQFGAPPA